MDMMLSTTRKRRFDAYLNEGEFETLRPNLGDIESAESATSRRSDIHNHSEEQRSSPGRYPSPEDIFTDAAEFLPMTRTSSLEALEDSPTSSEDSDHDAIYPWDDDNLVAVEMPYRSISGLDPSRYTSTGSTTQSGPTAIVSESSDEDSLEPVVLRESLFDDFAASGTLSGDLLYVGQELSSSEGARERGFPHTQSSDTAHAVVTSSSFAPPEIRNDLNAPVAATEQSDIHSTSGTGPPRSEASDKSATESQKYQPLTLLCNNEPFSAKLDTGSAICLLNDEIVERCSTEHRLRETVKVVCSVDGREFRITKRVRMDFRIAGLDKDCTATFYVLPRHLCRFDAIISEKVTKRWDLISLTLNLERSSYDMTRCMASHNDWPTQMREGLDLCPR